MTDFNNQDPSPFEGFSKLDLNNRIELLKQFSSLSSAEVHTLLGPQPGTTENMSLGLSLDQAEHLIENVIGVFALPLGLATHFKIDGKDVAVPMAVEETSIVAAASAAAKWVRRNGGFTTKALGNLIIGQIQFPAVSNPVFFKGIIEKNTKYLIDRANSVVPNLVRRGGGVMDIQIRELKRPEQPSTVVLHILCNPCDAMGANLINQVCEALKPALEEMTQEKIGLCILSNLTDTKLVEATCSIQDIDPDLANRIVEATRFANLDPYRCTTHNKGVLNGIDPILIATGNDWRAVEAGIHAYASRSGKYQSITEWRYEDGILKGRFCAPIAVGIVGGVTRIHPTARICLKILNVERASDLARICAATALGQNLAALRALCSEGIVQGHMRLHAANLAIAAGATNQTEVKLIQERLSIEELISLSRAKEILQEIRG